MQGNECRTLLKNVDILEDLVNKDNMRVSRSSTSETGTHPALPFISAFHSFNEVVATSFSMHLKPGWEEAIEKFQSDYLNCNISITTKAHIIFAHLRPFILENDCGLGVFSEQAFESIHAEFWKMWARYIIKDKSHPMFMMNLLKSALAFNALASGYTSN